jgi:hypothetical protein
VSLLEDQLCPPLLLEVNSNPPRVRPGRQQVKLDAVWLRVSNCPQRRAGAGQRSGLTLPLAGLSAAGPAAAALPFLCDHVPGERRHNTPKPGVRTHSSHQDMRLRYVLYGCLEWARMRLLFRHRWPS